MSEITENTTSNDPSKLWNWSELEGRLIAGVVAGGSVGVVADGVGLVPGMALGAAAAGVEWAAVNTLNSIYDPMASKPLPALTIEGGAQK